MGLCWRTMKGSADMLLVLWTSSPSSRNASWAGFPSCRRNTTSLTVRRTWQRQRFDSPVCFCRQSIMCCFWHLLIVGFTFCRKWCWVSMKRRKASRTPFSPTSLLSSKWTYMLKWLIPAWPKAWWDVFCPLLKLMVGGCLFFQVAFIK